MRLLRFRRFVWVIWKVKLPYRELRVIDEQGFMAWTEVVTVAEDRGPPVLREDVPG